MVTKYNSKFDNVAVEKRLRYLINQIYKLLPLREEKRDWKAPLTTIVEEIHGFTELFKLQNQSSLLALSCKLEGLYDLINEQDFFLFRRTIFECLNLMGEMLKSVRT